MRAPDVPAATVRNWSWPEYEDDTVTDWITLFDSGPVIMSEKLYETPWNVRVAFAYAPPGRFHVYEKLKTPSETPDSTVEPFMVKSKLP